MKRRELITGMAGAAAAAPAQGPAESGTLYIPPAHRVEDLALLHDTMEEFPFVELVTAAPSLRITHVPVWLDRKAGPYGALLGHIARKNPQSAAIESGSAATLVFRGPHAYISPSWFGNPNAAPTWNFAAVHVTGKLEAVTGEQPLYDLLAALIAKMEGKYGAGGYDFTKIPRASVSGMMKGTIGFRLAVQTIESKFKLGQERSEGDRAGLVRRLRSAAPERGIADLTESFYRKRPR
jgi:transcriptional regulator